MRRQLEDFTADELKDLPYDQILKLRADAYTRRVADMDVPPALQGWVRQMTRRHGPRVRVWQNECGWLEALLIVLYGEDPMQWPPAFTARDLDRAEGWYRGRRVKRADGGYAKGSRPLGVQYLDEDATDRGYVVTLGAVLAASLLTGAGVAAHVGPVAAMLAAIAVALLLGSALTDFWENELIDHLFRNRSYTAPSAMHIALFTAAPGEAGGGTEVSGGSYARVSYGTGATIWEGTGGETSAADSAGTGGATQNVNAITFPTPTANWGTVTHFAALDASSGGNMFFYGALAASKNVNNGDPAPSFAAGALDFSLA